ncbi:MAG TPA: efflux RND transporter periplasmic adaptor subunit [Vicinamibacterales bacterium]|nr:efflux RND transporter periplasmic adaptor subunit [Vicinamibacterales bacterium]
MEFTTLSKRVFVLASGPVLFVLAITGAGCSGSAASSGGGGRGGRGRGDFGAVPVVTTKVTERDVPVDIAAIGNVEAYTTISVRSQVTGQLEAADFREGDFVKKGQVLFTIDRRPFEAALQQAEANLTRDQALLTQAEAQLARDGAQAEYAQLTAERQASLLGRGIVSKDVSEQARAAADANAAGVKADRAAVESARAQLDSQKAAVDTAKVQLDYCIIKSPIDGKTGNLTVKTGNLVTANTTELMTIAQVEPIFVTFSVPALQLGAVRQRFGKERIAVSVTPQDGLTAAVDGALDFIDNSVDVTTDTIKLKGKFDNNDRRLWPGQFARVSIRITTLPHALVLPNQAVQTGQDGQFVFVVKSDSTVDQQPITTGQRIGDDVVVEKGLQAGQVVVTEGQLRLEAGTKVQVGDGRGGAGAGRGRGGRGRRGNGGGAGQQ